MPRTGHVSVKIEPEVKEGLEQLAEQESRKLSDYCCEVLAHHVAKFAPVERGGLVTIPVQVSAKEYAELSLINRYTRTSTQDLCLRAVQYHLNINKGLLGKIRRFLSVTPGAAALENPRFRFVQWTRDSRRQ